ncbi:MAG: CsbD family protein, partial [Anaerolineales bacterium]|nr:CsbD family protein [Anaerolineales bacterium]
MDTIEFEGKWKQMRGLVKGWWGKLTDDDLEQIGGQFDKLIEVVQAKYGYSRLRVEREFRGRM